MLKPYPHHPAWPIHCLERNKYNFVKRWYLWRSILVCNCWPRFSWTILSHCVHRVFALQPEHRWNTHQESAFQKHKAASTCSTRKNQPAGEQTRGQFRQIALSWALTNRVTWPEVQLPIGGQNVGARLCSTHTFHVRGDNLHRHLHKETHPSQIRHWFQEHTPNTHPTHPKSKTKSLIQYLVHYSLYVWKIYLTIIDTALEEAHVSKTRPAVLNLHGFI